MSRREDIEAALAAWREAERRLTYATDDEAAAVRQEIKLHRDEFQELSAANMVEWMHKLAAAENRRSHATPSTLPFHRAARETQEIASEIWEAARSSDEDTPQTEENTRRALRPARPGTV